LKTVIVIQGPTAVGKTAIAVAVAKQLGTAIVSADSRQCYKEMCIGTARPTPAEQEGVKHYFIDAFSVSEALTVADYEQLALGYLDEIFKNHDVAVVCGGTGLYIKALCEGIDTMPAVDEEVSRQINAAYATNGLEWLQQQVQNEDPEFYAHAEIHNPARLLRALIFLRSTGESITRYRTAITKQRPFAVVKAGIDLPREILYDRINKRVDIMMEQGLEEEARLLYPMRHLKNLQTVGYAELFSYFDGNCTRQEAIDKIKQNSRNYAKRQLTWFRKDQMAHWLRADSKSVVSDIIKLLDN
jgi:tRNA dimethylallyltransferase